MCNKSLREKEQRTLCVIILQTYINVVNVNVEHLAHTHGVSVLLYVIQISHEQKLTL